MDFITQFPVMASGHNAICVFVDRLTKMVRMGPTTSDVDAMGAARLFIEHVFRHHGMCTTLVTDRGTQRDSEGHPFCPSSSQVAADGRPHPGPFLG